LYASVQVQNEIKLNLTKSKSDNPYIYKERDKESTFSGRGSHLTCGI